MEYSFTAIVKVTAEHAKGALSSKHVSTDFRLEAPLPLDESQYNEDGIPTAKGSHALTATLIQGLVGNIHYAHEKGFRDSAEHLRYVISELERGFIAVSEGSTGLM